MRELDEKDWIIARLTYALYEEGRNSTHPDAIKTVRWFGNKRLLAAWSELAESKDKVPRFGTYWNKEAQPREWVGLTEGEQVLLARDYHDTPLTLIYAVGNMLKEKNNA